jgi:TrpR-related protein YerC/YecD
MTSFHIENFDELFEAILKLKSVEDCRKFFEDVCTIKELQDITQRLEVARLLKEGYNYQSISKETGASTATISRVNKCLNYGSGGYGIVLEDKGDK